MAGFVPQNIPVKMSSGVDTKSDPKSLQTKLTILQNASFQNPGEIQKRDGFAPLPQNILSGGSIGNGIGLGSFQEELITLDGANLYSYSPSLLKQLDRGFMVPTSLNIYPVVRNSNQQSYQDTAYHAASGLQIFVYLDSGSTQINYSVVDTANNALIIDNQLCAPGLYARVLTLGNNFIVSFFDASTGHLSYVAINVASPQTIGTLTTIATDIDSSDAQFDAAVINNTIYYCYQRIGSLAMYSLSTSLVLSSQFVPTITHSEGHISIAGDSSNNVWVGTANDSGGGFVCVFVVNAALTSMVLAETVVDDTQRMDNMSMAVNGTTATLFYSCQASGFNSDFIRKNTCTLTGTVGTASNIIRGSYLSSRIFTYNGSNYFFATYYGNLFPPLVPTIQQTYFLINGNGQVVAKVAPSLAGFYPTVSGSVLPNVVNISSSIFSFPYLIQENLSATGGNIYYTTGVQCANINFAFLASISKETVGSNLLIAGGQMWNYDGANINEQGFHIYPEQLSDTITITGGGIGSSIDTGPTNQVQYKAIFEWQDNQGQLHQSADSPALTVSIPPTSFLTALTITAASTAGSTTLATSTDPTAAGFFVGQVLTDNTNATNLEPGTYITQIVELSPSSFQIILSQQALMTEGSDVYQTIDVIQILVTVPTLKQTLKKNVSIVLYRTQNNQTIFYRVSSLTDLTYNDPTVDTITFTDALPDSLIIGNEQLYTNGGNLPNINPPAVSAITTYKNRAIYLSPENPFQWGYSQQVVGGSALAFDSLDLIENIDQAIGEATGVLGMDDKLLLWGPKKKFYVVGEGPSANGANNDFTDATPIIGTTGTQNQQSIVPLSTGVLYQDPEKGIWFLDRSLQENYNVGSDIEEYSTQQITSSQIFSDHNKVIFTLASGQNLVYDYFLGQWEVDPFSIAAVDSTIFQNKLTYLQASGLSLQETPGEYSDNGSVIPISLATGWLTPGASLQGFQRLWEVQILGMYFSPHTLTINIYQDFVDTPTQVVVIPVLTAPEQYRFRFKILRQKFEAIKIEIIESQSGTPGQGFSLSGIAFRAGMKKGLAKLPAGESF